MRYDAAIIYFSFYALVFACCYFGESLMPLWCLLLQPSFTWGDKKEDDVDG